MASIYPSPCLSCKRAEGCYGYTTFGGERRWCSKYEIWFKWWWKYFVKTFAPAQKPAAMDLRVRPCDKCSVEDRCDKPCPAYLRWYNARMEIARKKVGL